MANTEKLNLNLPTSSDYYNIEEFNENFRKIDEFAKNASQNENGGFSQGTGATATSGGAIGKNATSDGGGGAIGNGATSEDGGGAIGNGAKEIKGGGAIGLSASVEDGGGAVGTGTTTTSGGAVGSGAKTVRGGAVGGKSTSTSGGAVGNGATSTSGGAVGFGAKTSEGCAIGNGAITVDSSGNPIDAIQLGYGKNTNPKTLKIYSYPLLNADGTIPMERMPGVATIVTGSYVGTGTSSKDNPIILTFDFVPKVVIIDGCCVANYGCSESVFHTTSGQDYPVRMSTFWNDKTFSYFGTLFDYAGSEYTYVAIG